jgi:hypothetical protein
MFSLWKKILIDWKWLVYVADDFIIFYEINLKLENEFYSGNRFFLNHFFTSFYFQLKSKDDNRKQNENKWFNL